MKQLFLEGRYDSLVTSLSNKLLGIIKESYSAVSDPAGNFGNTKIFYKQGETIPHIEDDETQPNIYFEEVENATIPVEFYLQLKVQWIEDSIGSAGRRNDPPATPKRFTPWPM